MAGGSHVYHNEKTAPFTATNSDYTSEKTTTEKRQEKNIVQEVITVETMIVPMSHTSEILMPAISSESTVVINKKEAKMKEKMSESSVIPKDANLPGPSHQMMRPRILSQPKSERAILSDQIEGIVTLLLDHFPNVDSSQRTGLQQDAATIMYEHPVWIGISESNI